MGSIFQSGLLYDRSLIVAGDLSLTLSLDEVWGVGKIEDPISDFLKAEMEEMKLVDIETNVLCPTWSNGRCGALGLAKILDRFMLAEDLCEYFGKYRTWSHSLGFSDHKAVLLQIDFDKSLTKYPFKFNPIWLEDQQFCDFVRVQWLNFSQVHYSSVMYGFNDKLKKLNLKSKIERNFKKWKMLRSRRRLILKFSLSLI